MQRRFLQLFFLLITVPFLVPVFSCNEQSAKLRTATQADSLPTGINKADTIINYATKQLNFEKVVLFTIDSSIYHALDTTWFFSDSVQAYEMFFGGGSFVDSTGKPIHKRYTKTTLTKNQTEVLKNKFLPNLYSYWQAGCLPMYRDVLIFYDKSNEVVAQTQICLHCGQVTVYPKEYFNYWSESSLDWQTFKSFISQLKTGKYVHEEDLIK